MLQQRSTTVTNQPYTAVYLNNNGARAFAQSSSKMKKTCWKALVIHEKHPLK